MPINCLPNGTPIDPTCANQTLSIDNTVGDLSISNGNTVNLCPTVQLCQSITQITSFSLSGNVLQIIYLNETGVPQGINVDLTPILGGSNTITVQDTNSIDLDLSSDVLTAVLNIDPSSTLPISTGPSGVLFNCCPETPVVSNTTNTISLVGSGSGGHILTPNLKYQSSQSISFSDSSAGLTGSVQLSGDANNVITTGSDGALFVQSASSQLASLTNNGFITTGSSGTLLVGSDSKLYRIADPVAEHPITGNNTNTISLIVSGAGNHTLQANVNVQNSNTVNLSGPSGGLQASVNIDTVSPGNIVLSTDSQGLVANANSATIQDIQATAATVQNPMTKIYGNLANNATGYAVSFVSQYGVKIPSFTTTQRLAIPSIDLYDTMFVFDSTIRAFMWYDAVTPTWVQLT